MKKWCESMKANGATTIRVGGLINRWGPDWVMFCELQIPAKFPLTSETVLNCPNFAQGRNVLGVILMQLRFAITTTEIE